MAALLILHMTTCHVGIVARSLSRGVPSIVAMRLDHWMIRTAENWR
jgi:hypothetical protein